MVINKFAIKPFYILLAQMNGYVECNLGGLNTIQIFMKVRYFTLPFNFSFSFFSLLPTLLNSNFRKSMLDCLESFVEKGYK